MSIKCIAIDDEPMALEVISRFCQRYGDVKLHTFTNPVKGMEQVRSMEPDILFLDIEIGGVNGVKIARTLPPGVFLIFTTAYAQYALDGFELNAVDFLHKPFSYSRFERAMQKAVQLRTLQQQSVAPVFTEESITLKVEYKNTNIKLKDIIYIESMGNYVRIHQTGQPPVMSQISMKNVQELLPVDKFLRIHKSFIVPLHRIAGYTRTQITLYNKNITLPIGRTYYCTLLEKIKNKADGCTR